MSQAGGATRALAWVLSGLQTKSFKEVPQSRHTLADQFVAQGFSLELARLMADQAAAAGEVSEGNDKDLPSLEGLSREQAERQAVTIALALAESRIRVDDLTAQTVESQPLGERYRSTYPAALELAKLEAVELLDKLPVLTGNFGFTRGDATPGASRLVPFRNRRGNYVVYSDVAETEALFVRLAPTAVAAWLQLRGFSLDKWSDTRSARMAILKASDIPHPGDERGSDTAGSALLELVHSFAHRFIRQAALYSGIDRNALSELLVPAHLGFFVYAAARGDFVLGGLQAVFETELDRLLRDVVISEYRCPLDPGCQKAGGACMACLHLGEPSCRYYNGFLDRRTLWGRTGYFGLLKQE